MVYIRTELKGTWLVLIVKINYLGILTAKCHSKVKASHFYDEQLSIIFSFHACMGHICVTSKLMTGNYSYVRLN
jgi:hypothetical protein